MLHAFKSAFAVIIYRMLEYLGERTRILPYEYTQPLKIKALTHI